MNVVNLLGRMTKNPELRQTNSGKGVVEFGIAVDRPFKSEGGEKEVDFFNVVFWGKQAEVICQYFQKGSRILVQGRLQNDKYTAKDGAERTATKIIGSGFDFIDGKSTGAVNKEPSLAAGPAQKDTTEFPF